MPMMGRGKLGRCQASKADGREGLKTLDYRIPSGIAHSLSTSQAPHPASGKDWIFPSVLLPELLREAANLGRNLPNYLKT